MKNIFHILYSSYTVLEQQLNNAVARQNIISGGECARVNI